MIKNSKSNRLGILSPWTLGGILGLVSVSFFLIPNDFYSIYIREDSNLFLNFKAMAYIFLCTVTFCISSYFSHSVMMRSKNRVLHNASFATGTVLILTAVLLASNLFYVLYSIGVKNILLVYSGGGSYNGNFIKLQLSEILSNGKLGWITDMCAAFIVWSFYNVQKRPNRIRYFIISMNIGLYLLNSIASISRDSIISLVIMLACVYALHLSKRGKLSSLKVLLSTLAILFCFIAVFAIIGLVRSSNFSSASYEIIKQFMGYFPASYNRLAFVLDGRLVYPNSGWGFYASQFLWDVPLISGGLGIYRFGNELGIPLPSSAEINWLNQFSAVQNSGLNSSYIWSTIFGFLYSDFGYYSVVYFMLYGVVAGIFYELFYRGDNLGLVVFPFIVASIIKWPSIVSFSQRGIIIFFIAWSIIVTVNNIRQEGGKKDYF